jgi:hypothetical protein
MDFEGTAWVFRPALLPVDVYYLPGRDAKGNPVGKPETTTYTGKPYTTFVGVAAGSGFDFGSVFTSAIGPQNTGRIVPPDVKKVEREMWERRREVQAQNMVNQRNAEQAFNACAKPFLDDLDFERESIKRKYDRTLSVGVGVAIVGGLLTGGPLVSGTGLSTGIVLEHQRAVDLDKAESKAWYQVEKNCGKDWKDPRYGYKYIEPPPAPGP